MHGGARHLETPICAAYQPEWSHVGGATMSAPSHDETLQSANKCRIAWCFRRRQQLLATD